MHTGYKTVLWLLVSFCFAACSCGDKSNKKTVAQVIATSEELTLLNKAITKAAVGQNLSIPSATLTLFAPTDLAFTDLATQLGFPSAVAMVDGLPPASLKAILLYHLLDTIKMQADL